MPALQTPAGKRWFVALTATRMVALVSVLLALNVAGLRDRLLMGPLQISLITEITPWADRKW